MLDCFSSFIAVKCNLSFVQEKLENVIYILHACTGIFRVVNLNNVTGNSVSANKENKITTSFFIVTRGGLYVQTTVYFYGKKKTLILYFSFFFFRHHNTYWHKRPSMGTTKSAKPGNVNRLTPLQELPSYILFIKKETFMVLLYKYQLRQFIVSLILHIATSRTCTIICPSRLK